jgi:hypothetical protein
MPLQSPESVDRIPTMLQPTIESLPGPTGPNLYMEMPGKMK